MAKQAVEVSLEQAVAGTPEDLQLIARSMASLIRGETADFDPYLQLIESHKTFDSGRGIVHSHFISLDGNGRVRLKDLMAHLATALVDYSIPRSKISHAFAQFRETGSSASVVGLARQAQQLFVDIANTGEGGELLLFLFAEKFLKLPQVLCKMNLKTSGNVHFHGSDGIHIGADEDGKLQLYWSESKIYQTLATGLVACLKSLAAMLTATNAEQSRDLQLVGDYLDLDSPELENALRKFLDPQTSAFNTVEFRGLCLVGFDSSVYPSAANQKTLHQLLSEFLVQSPTWRESVRKALLANQLDSYAIHVFCLPVPSAEEFRLEFLRAIGKGDGAS